jgi:hypothetical protein
LFSFSCRKIGQTNSDSYEIKIEEKYFNEHRSESLIEKTLVEYIKSQNCTKKFVEKTVSQIGYPRWNKKMVYNFINNKGADTTATLYFIPFVRTNENYVNSAMLIRASKFDTSFSYICDWQYSQNKNSKTDTVALAESYAVFFMNFDKLVFNSTEFIITDTLLFNFNNKKAVRVRLDSITNSGKLNSLVPIEFCQQVTIFQQNCPYIQLNGFCFGPNGACDNCIYCTNEVSTTYCWTQWVESIGGGSSNNNESIGTSGGGGGNNGIPPNCSGTLSLSKIDNYIPSCGPGWFPILGGGFSEYNPNQGAALFNSFSVKPIDQIKIDYWKINNLDTTGLDSCRKLLLKKLISVLPSKPLGALLVKLDEAIGLPTTIDKFNLHFKTKPLLNYIALTQNATYDSISNEFEVDIVLDSATTRNSTDIFLATTMLHEIVHAYMEYIWKKFNSGIPSNLVSGLTYGTVFNAYVDTLKKRDSLNPGMNQLIGESYHHNYMADKLLGYMSEIIKLFHDDSTTTDEYYWDLVWSGLTRNSVKTWNYHWPNFPSWPPSNPAPVNDSLRGLRYALTLARIDTIYNKVLYNEEHATINAKGKKPVLNGCY